MKLRFQRNILVTHDVTSFLFAPLEPISWIAGQSIRLELPAPDYGTSERRFTISSAPYEGYIAITTRPSDSEFKQTLFSLSPGDDVDAYSVEGDFIWPHDLSAPLFVAAGIGITPFYAMLKQRLHDQLLLDATLLHAYRDHNAPFADEFATMQKSHPEFSVAHITAQHLQGSLIAQHVPDISNRITYISGPSSMVEEVKNQLTKIHGASEAHIICDLFTGRLPADG